MDKKPIHPFHSNDDAVEISGTLRDVPPADYVFQIKSFSLFSVTKEKRFESGDFESGGYKWKLCLYPNGDEKRNGKDHISLYLAISETDTLPLGWGVNVKFDLFVYDHIRDKYLTIQNAGGRVRHFHRFKTEFGFAKLLSLDTFKDASNGYLIDDSCMFGAEVYVIKSTGRGECLSLKEETYDNSYTWEIKSFSEIKDEELFSESFTIGKLKWKLIIYPKGIGCGEGKSLSVFLELVDYGFLSTKKKFYAKYSLRVKDRVNGKHCEIKDEGWFGGTSKGWGSPKAISLADLYDKSKGFIVQDSLVVEAQIHLMSDVKE